MTSCNKVASGGLIRGAGSLRSAGIAFLTRSSGLATQGDSIRANFYGFNCFRCLSQRKAQLSLASRSELSGRVFRNPFTQTG
jgi:hypothetical protein